jgi:adenosylhomocysteine nucleosidase
MAEQKQLAIVCALEMEVRPVLRRWKRVRRDYDGRVFKFFEATNSVLVAGGIGAQAARRATEAVIALYRPELVVSLGFCGGVDSSTNTGDLIVPGRVVDAGDGSSTAVPDGEGTLVSVAEVASPEQKAQLARSYSARAVDMEAAAVARGAEARGIRFMAVKAVSDNASAKLPPFGKFIDPAGDLHMGRTVIYCLMRPWLWPRLIRFERGSRQAANVLSHWIQSMANNPKFLNNEETELHPTVESNAHG